METAPFELFESGGLVSEWLACWTQAQKSPGSNRSRDAVVWRDSLRQTVHTHCASVHQTAKLVAALLRAARVTAGLAESNGSLPPGLWHVTCSWLPRTEISSGTLCFVIQYGLHLPFALWTSYQKQLLIGYTHTQTHTPFYRPFVRDYPGEPVPER